MPKNLNRVVAVFSALLALALAILPVIGNFDWQSTAGILGGIIAILGITQTWLAGWQKHEAREAKVTNVEGEGTGGKDDPYDPNVDTVAPTTNQLIHEQHDIHEADEALGGDDF